MIHRCPNARNKFTSMLKMCHRGLRLATRDRNSKNTPNFGLKIGIGRWSYWHENSICNRPARKPVEVQSIIWNRKKSAFVHSPWSHPWVSTNDRKMACTTWKNHLYPTGTTWRTELCDHWSFDDEMRIELSRQFQMIRVDGDRATADRLMKKYNVKGYPTLQSVNWKTNTRQKESATKKSWKRCSSP